MADDGAVAWINGTRVSPTSWGLDPGTTVGGAIHYDRLSTRFQANGTNEHAYDVLTLSGASLPALLPAPALNVLAIEVHQNTFDSSDCSLDGALFASLAAPSTGTAGITPISGTSWLYWTDAAWTPETTSDLGNWISRPDLRSPVPLLDAPRRQFYRLRTP
jgi:hypothetical protein